jgi:hypothetical protein
MPIPLKYFFIAVLTAIAVRADYRIGQTEVPAPLIRETTAFQVYPQHPRLYFRDTDKAALQKRIAGDFRPEWDGMRAMLERTVLSHPASDFAQGTHLKAWQPARDVAFVAAITGEKKYLVWAREWAAALAAAGPVGNDSEYRGRLQSLAVAYDWLYPWLSAGEKHAIQEAIVAHVEKCWSFAEGKTNYVSGHSRWGNFALAAGLLAVVSEKPELREKLLMVRNHWINGYFPAQGWIANEGGYHMGWAYSAAYLTGDIHVVWSSATNDCVFFPWEAKLPLFWIYGKQGDGFYPNTGDAYTVHDDVSSERVMLLIAEGIFKDPHAAWLLQPSDDHFAEILYGDKRVRPMAPDAPGAVLPLSRQFGHSGVVVVRDRWDRDTTLLQFRSVPFYSTNHHHRDENSFTLHYRGPLAIDSGFYDEGGAGTQKGGYGGVHWNNYFTRTVAHNAIVVYDPAQKMSLYGSEISNDGGQVFRSEPETVDDLRSGGSAHLDGITHYQATPDYTAISGDASKAYDPDRVRVAQREMVYLRGTSRPHPLVVVFDRVESTKPEFEKHFLLHTVNHPLVQGNVTVAENNGGRLSCVTLLPENAKLEVIGGPGKEAWVDGKNYPWNPPVRPRVGIEPGAWRLEVSPAAQQTRDYFLQVLFVDDATAPAVNPRDVRLIKREGQVEVQVDGWMLSFPLANGGEPRVERLKPTTR